MATLVTGSAGLVGHAVRLLLDAAGEPVVPVDRVSAVREADPRVRAEPDPVAAQGWPGRLDLSAAARDLGWEPRWTLAEGVVAMRAALGPDRP